MQKLTQKRLQEVLSYDPETGSFAWRNPKRNAAWHVGYRQSHGYLMVCIDYGRFLLHRLAWLYMTGEWPTKHIDHINGNRTDNRFKNLRDVTCAENAQNKKSAHRDSKTGLLGVTPCNGRFRATIFSKGKHVSLGVHDTPDLAQAAYLSAKKNLHINGDENSKAI